MPLEKQSQYFTLQYSCKSWRNYTYTNRIASQLLPN